MDERYTQAETDRLKRKIVIFRDYYHTRMPARKQSAIVSGTSGCNLHTDTQNQTHSMIAFMTTSI